MKNKLLNNDGVVLGGGILVSLVLLLGYMIISVKLIEVCSRL